MTAIAPLQRWTRDDWVIPCTLQDSTGTAVDLTGSKIVAELWLAGYRVFQPLTVSNGGIIRTADTAGQFLVIANRILTSKAPGDAALVAPVSRTRILIAMIDPQGRRQTLGVVPFKVFDGSEDLRIDDFPALTIVSETVNLRLVVAASQGPPGPSNIPAAQISDSGATGQGLMKAANAGAAVALLGVVSNRRAPVADSDYAVSLTDTYVALTALTAPRTITLPLASAYPPGQALYIVDESGQCSTDRPIIIAGAGQDTIGTQSRDQIASPFQKAVLHSNGTNLWTV